MEPTTPAMTTLLKIHRTGPDAAYFLSATLLRGILPLAIAGFGFVFHLPIISLPALALFLRHYVFTHIDYLFPITFLQEKNGLAVRFLGIRFPLSLEDSFLVIVETGNRSLTGKKTYHLRLVRNCGSAGQRLLKNRIRIAQAGHQKLVAEMMAIHAKTGLRFVDFFDHDPEPGWHWTDLLGGLWGIAD